MQADASGSERRYGSCEDGRGTIVIAVEEHRMGRWVAPVDKVGKLLEKGEYSPNPLLMRSRKHTLHTTARCITGAVYFENRPGKPPRHPRPQLKGQR